MVKSIKQIHLNHKMQKKTLCTTSDKRNHGADKSDSKARKNDHREAEEEASSLSWCLRLNSHEIALMPKVLFFSTSQEEVSLL